AELPAMTKDRDSALGTRDSAQLELVFAEPPGDERAEERADVLLTRLRALGLVGIVRCRLTSNRTVMVSFRGDELRVHRAYLAAPNEVLRAIVAFVCGRRRAARRAAQRVILAFPVAAP